MPKKSGRSKSSPPARKRRSSRAKRSFSLDIPKSTQQEIAAVVLVAGAAITILSLLTGDELGLMWAWREVLARALGWGAFLMPAAMVLLAMLLFRRAGNPASGVRGAAILGFVLTGIAVLGLVHNRSDGPLGPGLAGAGGGAAGDLIRSFLELIAGSTGAQILLYALAIVGTMLIFRISLSQLGGALRGLASQVHRLMTAPSATETIYVGGGGNGRSAGAEVPPARSQGRGATEPIEPIRVPEPPPAPPPPILNTGEELIEPETLPPKTVPEWRLPSYELLSKSSPAEINREEMLKKAKVIEEALANFNVQAVVREINPGPTVTQFALEPAPGVKVSKITSLSNDLALALAASSIRIEAPVPGQSRVGIEIPNSAIALVCLRDVMESGAFQRGRSKLRLPLGRDVSGQAVVGDLAKMPHLLIAGATGSGKSVCINSIIACLLFHCTPLELRFLMVDPKMVELAPFDGVPHLLAPVVTDLKKVVGVLRQAVAEMERRYDLFAQGGFRNIEAYNRKATAPGSPRMPLPYIVVVIDELADLMMVAPDEVETLVCRLAQMARATGIHLVIATQRPSVDVVTGLIKANFPSRIAFAVTSQIDSRVILDMAGAEKLLGRGDMLFTTAETVKPVRVQGAYVADPEIEALVGFWKGIYEPQYEREFLELPAMRVEAESSGDKLLPDAVQLVRQHRSASVSMLQRRLRVGYNRAANLMELMEEKGVVSLAEDGRTWEVILTDDVAGDPAEVN